MSTDREMLAPKAPVVFRVDCRDNVGVALSEIPQGAEAYLIGESAEGTILAKEKITLGHKIALKPIQKGENVVKYGVVIGRALSDIGMGQWVHIHVMKSLYDERSEYLDVHTGAPKDTRYA